MESINNQTFIALNKDCFYNGTYDDVLKYKSFTLNIISSNVCKINIIQSNDTKNVITTSIDYTTTNVEYVYSSNLSSRYIYFQILNNSGSNMSKLAFTVLYRDSFINNSSSDVSIISPLVGGAVNIAGSVSLDGVGVDIGSNSLLTKVTNTIDCNITNSSIAVTNSDLSNIYTVVNSRGSGLLWSGSSTGINGTSLSINLSSKNIKNITIFGNCSSATVLTVQFSNDGTNYYDSQYSYTLSVGGDLGFNIPCCPYYVRLKSSLDVTATLYANYC